MTDTPMNTVINPNPVLQARNRASSQSGPPIRINETVLQPRPYVAGDRWTKACKDLTGGIRRRKPLKTQD